jgi:hypothetical protein
MPLGGKFRDIGSFQKHHSLADKIIILVASYTADLQESAGTVWETENAFRLCVALRRYGGAG